MQERTNDNFERMILQELQKRFPGEGMVQIIPVTKNNGLTLRGLTIKSKDTNVCPTLYLDSMFEQWVSGERDLLDIVDELCTMNEKYKCTKGFDVASVTHWDAVKDKIRLRLLNKELNSNRLSEIPYFTFLDLIVTFVIQLDCEHEEGVGTIQVRNEFLEMWGISKDELLETGKKNNESSEYYIEDMFSALAGMIGDLQEGTGLSGDTLVDSLSGPSMYVLSNSTKLFGSDIILRSDELDKLAETLHSSFFILPSSVHELLAVPGEDEPKDESMIEGFKSMIYTINREQVSLQERLSDSLYHYNRHTHLVSIC